MTSIQSGHATVIAAGQVTTFFGGPLRFLDIAGWEIELAFESAPETPGLRVDTSYTPAGVRFALVNFEEAQGRGTAQPVFIGDSEQGALFFHFRSFRHGASADYTLHYTFFVADPQAIGLAPEVVEASGQE